MKNGAMVSRWRDEDGEIAVVDSDGIRYLYFGNDIIQSAVDLDDPSRLVLSYTRAMAVGLLLAGETPKEALLIGLGGGALVHFLRKHYPDTRITVAEKRIPLIDIARQHFMLDQLPGIEYFAGDGLSCLQTSSHNYDIIMVDAFDDNGVSSQVCDDSFLDECRHHLTHNGVMTVNLWRSQAFLTEDLLEHTRQLFAGHTLTLPLQDKGNLIVFAGQGIAMTTRLRSLRDRAGRLEAAWGFELRRLLKQVRPASKASWITKALRAITKS